MRKALVFFLFLALCVTSYGQNWSYHFTKTNVTTCRFMPSYLNTNGFDTCVGHTEVHGLTSSNLTLAFSTNLTVGELAILADIVDGYSEANVEQVLAEEAAAEQTRMAMLTSVVGIYRGFLTNEWTTCLRTAHLIAGDKTIDFDTTAFQNMMYLMQLRVLDVAANKPTYSYYKNEFSSFRDNIERLGGDMGSLK